MNVNYDTLAARLRAALQGGWANNPGWQEEVLLMAEASAAVVMMQQTITTAQQSISTLASGPRGPIPMLLFCPRCAHQHVDEPKGEWKNPPHATHTCQYCQHLWRPSNVNTVGVEALEANEMKHLERFAASWPAPAIFLRGSEIQSASSRVRWAEGLIANAYISGGRTHEGLSSWLMNYGIGGEAIRIRQMDSRDFVLDDRTQSFNVKE